MTNPDDIIKEFGLDPVLFPDGIKQYLSKFIDDNGAITLWSVGLMLPESDLDLVRACIYQFNPLVVITANKELYRLGLKENLESLGRDDDDADECDVEKLATQPIRFTHFAPWYERNIWLKLFAAPIKS